jgi:hypothetical protein
MKSGVRDRDPKQISIPTANTHRESERENSSTSQDISQWQTFEYVYVCSRLMYARVFLSL